MSCEKKIVGPPEGYLSLGPKVHRFLLDFIQVHDYTGFSMSRKWIILVVALVVAAVAIVFFAPSVDLPPTAMRSLEVITAVFLAVAAIRHLACSIFRSCPVQRRAALADVGQRKGLYELSLIDLNCARLC